MSDPGCPRGHVWVTYPNAKVSVCQNCGADRPVAELAKDDPLNSKLIAKADTKDAGRVP